MKLVIQIPAWNEEASLPDALASLPRRLAGFSEVAILVVDDGSTDGTAGVRAEGPGRHLGVPGLHSRGGAAPERLLEDDLHAGDSHPGRVQGLARRVRARARAPRAAGLAAARLAHEVRPDPGRQHP